jgi:hypothetical protein
MASVASENKLRHRLGAWIARLSKEATYVVARYADAEEEPIGQVDILLGARETAAEELGEMLQSAADCADRPVGISVIAYGGKKAHFRLYIRVRPTPETALTPTALDPDATLVKVLTAHVEVLVTQIVNSHSATVNSYRDTLVAMSERILSAEQERRTAESVARDALEMAEVAQSTAGQNKRQERIADKLETFLMGAAEKKMFEAYATPAAEVAATPTPAATPTNGSGSSS